MNICPKIDFGCPKWEKGAPAALYDTKNNFNAYACVIHGWTGNCV